MHDDAGPVTGAESTAASPSDAELVVRARSGDRAAFGELARRHYRSVYTVALAVTRHREDAEDICQEAFLLAAERLHECREPSQFKQWVSTIARNRGRNLIMRFFRSRSVSSEDVVLASPNDTSARTERDELRRRLEAAIGRLPAKERSVLLLHDLDDWSHRAIAEFLGMSEVMSRQRLFNARRKLRALLGRGVPITTSGNTREET